MRGLDPSEQEKVLSQKKVRHMDDHLTRLWMLDLYFTPIFGAREFEPMCMYMRTTTGPNPSVEMSFPLPAQVPTSMAIKG